MHIHTNSPELFIPFSTPMSNVDELPKINTRLLVVTICDNVPWHQIIHCQVE